MKQKLTYLLFMTGILIFIISINLTFAQVSSSCSPSIRIINQDPIPAIPDSYVKIVIEISNLGSCPGFAIDLKPSYPFSLDPGTETIYTINSAPYAPDFKNTWDIPVKVRIAPDALAGDYDFTMLYHSGNTKDFSINSYEKDLNISIVDSQTNFATVIQGTSGSQVSIGIVNTGENTANSLIVGIPSQPNFRSTGTSQQIVGNLAAGDYTLVSFTLTPTSQRGGGNGTFNRNATGGQPPNLEGQTLKVQLDYTDSIGKRRTVINNITYNPAAQGNITGFNRNGIAGRNSAASSGYPWWYYVIIIVVVIIILYILYRIFGSRLRHLFKGEKNSSKTPDWVSAERSHKK